jgi:hypothetical protein
MKLVYLFNIFFYINHMQTKIDWTTGGLSFYDVDPPKRERGEDFTPDFDINSQFDPIPSQ